ncbi:hypothetical protein GOP47_0016673 [Adiantum capillus-veneris]|uniref:BTB domain-containing protein n=1 Tax=Adiantum capillus-veneris TaxID=13818 RepID=A0A9D4UJ11_ADICA|nr:hypothetical protein GOP47_0016673 [Adiantum capillus-veneris]
MPHRVQCLVCRCVLSAHNSRQFCVELDVEYAYCKRCYREGVVELEATIASYRTGVRKHKEEWDKRWLSDHLRRVEFLASGWSNSGHKLKVDSTQSHELQNLSGQGLLFADVLLCPVDGPPVPAHKAVLAGRSSVFRAMFCSCPMKEAKSGVVMMDDLNAEALTAFVGFLYTAVVVPEVMQKHSVALLSAAEKYDIALLRIVCEDAIAKNIGAHNAISILELARKFGSQVLHAAVLDFVSQDIEHLFLLEEYQIYAKKDPSLLLELYERLIERNRLPMVAYKVGCKKRIRSFSFLADEKD